MKTLQVLNFRNLYGSGLTESVPALCTGLQQLGVDTWLFTPRARPEWLEADYRVSVHPTLPGMGWLGWCPSMKRELIRQSSDADLIHCHEMWTLPGVYASQIAHRSRRPCVISPRGTFSNKARSFSSFKKKIMWTALRKSHVLKADCLHATAPHECRDIRSLGFGGPVAVIPNSVHVPQRWPSSDAPTERHTLAFLARIHPIKGISTLLNSWQQLASEFPEWDLKIAGVDDGGHLAELKQLANNLKLTRVTFVGPVFDNEKSNFLNDADLYCLPTLSENFGITIAEALAYGLPVVTTTGAPWQGLTEHRCGWWVSPELSPIREALAQAMSKPKTELRAMGERGRQWVIEEFSNQAVSEKMKATYEWILNGGTTPAWIDESEPTG